MTPASVVFLGAIAVATVVMALIQVVAIIYAVRVGRRVEVLMAKLEHDIHPIIEKVTSMTGEASRVASAAGQQVEKIERIVSDLTGKVDRTVATAQRFIVAPGKQSVAIAAAVKATVGTLRDIRRQRREARHASDDDDQLFIG